MDLLGYFKRRKLHFIFTLILISYCITAIYAIPKPFLTIKKDKVVELPDTSWVDSYAYLEDKNDKVTQKYIKKEIAYHKSVNSYFFYLYRKLVYNLERDSQIGFVSAPYRIGDWYYYYAADQLVPYGVEYRIHRETGKTQMLINLADFHQTKKTISINIKSFSPNDKYMAYSANFDGTEEYTLMIKMIKADRLMKDKIQHAVDMVWLPDSKGLLYLQEIREDHHIRLAIHTLESDVSNDTVLYENFDPACFVSLKLSRDKQLVFLSEKKGNVHKIYQIHLNNPKSPELLFTKLNGTAPVPDFFKGDYFLTTDENNPDNDFILCSDSTFKSERVLCSGKPNRPITQVSIFDNYIAVTELFEGMPRVKTINRTTNTEYGLDIKQKYYNLSEYYNYEADTDTLNLVFDSFIIPTTIMKLNMKTKNLQIVHKISPYKGFDSKAYTQEMVYVEGKDSISVPMIIVYKKDLFKKNNPCLLYVYGSYGEVLPESFSKNKILMMDRGWIYAYPQIRGGGEYGQSWYHQGKKLNKKNTFTDIINSAEYLINHQYTSPQKLAIEGGSAGGLAVAVVINERPELFNTAILSVPATDVVTPQIDHNDPSAIFHHEELGDPLIKNERDYLFSYSPYHNIKAQKYPYIYASTGINDPRVPFYVPLKWVAKLREMKTDDHALILNISNYKGHFDTFQEDKKDAFLIWTIEKDCE